MALLALQAIGLGGLDPAYAPAATGGDTVKPGSHVFLHVKNAAGAQITVTVDSVKPCSQGTDHNLAVDVPAGDDRMIGPINERFAQPATALANITYSATANVTVGAFVL